MKKILPYVLILIVLFIAAGLYLDLKKVPMKTVEAMQSTDMQSKKESMMKTELKDYGSAPDFFNIQNWINSEKLSTSELKGKVVLVDFWTYSCINCIRTIPYVNKWYDTYKDKGLVVVGVHTPEFGFEKEYANVVAAVKRFNIHYPVAQDNQYATWNAYNNQYWPAEYLIDQKGKIVYVHFGEGEYDKTEQAIRQLLGLDLELTDDQMMSAGTGLKKIGSPEMYFGTNRLEFLSDQQKASISQKYFNFPETLQLNNFALEGTWRFTAESVVSEQSNAKIRLKFNSGKLHMVARSEDSQSIRISVDGKAYPDVVVNDSELYTLFDSEDYTDHVIEILIPQKGFEAFTFTFG